MNPVIAIVSDDLTGSGDTAVQFVRAGWSTHLSIGGADEALAGDGRPRCWRSRRTVAPCPPIRPPGSCAPTSSACDRPASSACTEGRFHAAGPVPPKSKRPAPPGRRTRSRSSALLFRHRPDRVRRRAAGERQTGHRDLGRDRPGHAGHRKPYPQPAPMRPCRPDGLASADELAARIERAGRIVVVDAADEAELERLAQAIGLAARAAGRRGRRPRRWPVSGLARNRLARCWWS